MPDGYKVTPDMLRSACRRLDSVAQELMTSGSMQGALEDVEAALPGSLTGKACKIVADEIATATQGQAARLEKIGEALFGSAGGYSTNEDNVAANMRRLQ